MSVVKAQAKAKEQEMRSSMADREKLAHKFFPFSVFAKMSDADKRKVIDFVEGRGPLPIDILI